MLGAAAYRAFERRAGGQQHPGTDAGIVHGFEVFFTGEFQFQNVRDRAEQQEPSGQESGQPDPGGDLPAHEHHQGTATAREGENPVLVTSGGIRPFVRSLVERFRAQTTVMSQSEIHPRARLKTVGSI